MLKNEKTREVNPDKWLDANFSCSGKIENNYNLGLAKEPFNPKIKSLLEILRPSSNSREQCKTEFKSFISKDPFYYK